MFFYLNSSVYEKLQNIILSAVIIFSLLNIYQSKVKKQTEQALNLTDIEAMAFGEDGDEKGYTYVDTGEKCVIYIGGTGYVEGIKVSCHQGDKYPQCADCKL